MDFLYFALRPSVMCGFLSHKSSPPPLAYFPYPSDPFVLNFPPCFPDASAGKQFHTDHAVSPQATDRLEEALECFKQYCSRRFVSAIGGFARSKEQGARSKEQATRRCYTPHATAKNGYSIV